MLKKVEEELAAMCCGECLGSVSQTVEEAAKGCCEDHRVFWDQSASLRSHIMCWPSEALDCPRCLQSWEVKQQRN